MTLHQLTNAMTIQGNVEIKIFAEDGTEIERRFLRDLYDFNCTCEDCDDIEDLEITYMYATKSLDSEAWLAIELLKEDAE